jgi:hypothetical protein
MLCSVAVGGSLSKFRADLSGVYVKVDRAKAHLKEFDTQSRPIVNACKQALKRAYDGKQSEYVIRLDPVPDVPSVLSAIIGDAIHNLRVSLDHLAWQLVIAAEETPNRDTVFPIRKTQPGLDDFGLSLPNIKPGIPEDMRRILDEVQPYKRERPENHDLVTLHNLDISDKHHQLLVAVLGIHNNIIGWWGDLAITKLKLGPYDNDSEVCRYTSSTDSAPKMDFAVRLNDPAAGPWGTMLGATDLARRSLTYIEDEVFPRFTHFFSP